MPQVRCATCGKSFEAQRSTAKYCGGTCRKRAGRRAGAPMTTSQVGAVIESSGLARATQVELRKLGKLDSIEGVAAVQIATRMENPAESGQAVAALADRLLKIMVVIRNAAPAQQDEVAVAREAREEKRRRAAAGQASG